MNVLSIEFIGLIAVAPIIVWLFSKKSKIIPILVCNALFLIALRGNQLDWLYVCVLTLCVYLCSLYIHAKKSKTSLFVSVMLLTTGLCYYKYAGYFLDGRILMPLGLSFYTFKSISYVSDVYHDRIKIHSLIEVFDYITFFPTFMAGPINKAEPFFEELNEPLKFDYLDQKNGFILAVFGLFEKMVIADEFNQLVPLFLRNDALNGWYVVLGVFLYAMQIYADFDAYSNVAIGVSRMLGIHLERNFNTPYLAHNIKEFWRRWHISLSTWLKDYIYIPLGGNRKGKVRKYLNVMIVFLVSGIWHGSTMMFVIWGLGHGLLTVIEDLLNTFINKKWFKPFGIVINFVLVSMLWVFFQADSMQSALNVFEKMKGIRLTTISSMNYETIGITLNEWYWMFTLIGIVFVTDLFRNHTDMIDWLSRRIFIVRWFIYIVIIFVWIIFGVYGPGFNPADFIYVTF